MATQSPETQAQIDEFLPNYNLRALYEIRINTPRSIAYKSLLSVDFSDLWLTRLLMTLRSGRQIPRHNNPAGLLQRLQGTGFVVLEELTEDEIVIGIAGRFWRPDGGRCMDLTETNFINFCQPGFAKAAWNFKLRGLLPEPEITILSTETRIQCFGPAALWRFRLYWSLVGPFSGLIRQEMLKLVKTKAESRVR